MESPNLLVKIALDFVLKNESNSDSETYNPYIREFCRQPWIKDVLDLSHSNYSVKQLMNHKSLKKEVTETWGALKLVERGFRRKTGGSMTIPSDSFESLKKHSQKLLFFDVCCGKGIFSFLASFMFPDAEFVMIDFDAKIKFEHLHIEQAKNISFRHIDIYTSEFEAYLSYVSSK